MQLLFSDRVATLAWNGYRHLELYFGVSGSGRVLHAQPAAAPGADRLDRQPCGGPGAVLRHDLPARGAGGPCKCTTIRHYVALCDAGKLPKDTGIPNLVSYEDWIGGQQTTYQWPRSTRTRPPACATRAAPRAIQGGPVQPPLHHPARLRGRAAGRDEPVGARFRAAGGAHVPRQRLGHSVLRRAHRLQAGVPRRQPGRQVGVRADRAGAGDLCRRRAHRVADAPGPHEAGRPALLHAQAHRDRRLPARRR